jgi:hypothetical protein
MIKRAGTVIACLALTAGFCALIVWALQTGVAPGKYAAVARADTPGLYWFFISGLAVMALILIANGIKTVVPGFRAGMMVLPGFAVLLPFGVWALAEMAGSFWKTISAVPETSGRLIYAGLAVMVVGVLATLLYTLIWPEVRALWSKRGKQED